MADTPAPASPAPATAPPDGDVEATIKFPRRWLGWIVTLAMAGSGGGVALAGAMGEPQHPAIVECPNTPAVRALDERTRALEIGGGVTATKLDAIAAAINQLDTKLDKLNSPPTRRGR